MRVLRNRNVAVITYLSVVFLFLTGCSTTSVSLTYDPKGVSKIRSETQDAIVITSVTDLRRKDANWLGAIRNGFGGAMKTLETSAPIKEIVKSAYVDGLKARGLLASDVGQFEMRLQVRRFDCSQYVRRHAHIVIKVTLAEKTSTKPVFTKFVVVDKVDRAGMDTGLFASVEDLRKIANQVLQEAVDQTLDDPELHNQLR